MIKSKEEIKIMRAGGKILAGITAQLAEQAKEGVTLKDLDQRAEELMRAAGGVPAFLGYQPNDADRPYSASICTSLNEVVVHGLPTNYRLKSGDVLKLDLGLLYKGFYTDTAVTVGIGKISPQAKKLIAVTKRALELAIDICQPGKTLGDLGAVVEKYIRSQGFKIVQGLGGHGIGKQLHESPFVANEGKAGAGPKLVPGMTLAIEPMVSVGSAHIVQLPDQSYATEDKSLSAQFEHTVAITDNGPEILTKID